MTTMRSMARSRDITGKDKAMEEKTYKTMGKSGAFNITAGVVMICAGIALGVMMIINGGKLLAQRAKIMF